MTILMSVWQHDSVRATRLLEVAECVAATGEG